jgi:hypothetical protein
MLRLGDLHLAASRQRISLARKTALTRCAQAEG